MATFAKATFDAAGYLACRPTYPTQVYNIILAYHTGGHKEALDLGCGPGFMALNLAPAFEHVTAIDPSAAMIKAGIQHDKVSYSIGDAETIPLPDQSVDLVVAGQAAHWFNHAKSWPELKRVVRPGGTVAYVGYGEINFPSNSIDFSQYAHGPELDGYWGQPGRSIVEGLLDAVPFPSTPKFTTKTEELLATLPTEMASTPAPLQASKIDEPALPSRLEGWDPESAVRLKFTNGIKRKWNLSQLEGYMRTFSALHAFHEAHPEDKKVDGGDVVSRYINKVKSELGGGEFDVEWPLVLMMIKRE